MRKLLVGLPVFFLVGLAIVYFLIPQEIKVSTIAVIKANEHAAYRSLTNDESWKKWWPVKNDENKSGLGLNGFEYRMGIKQLDGIEVIITNKKNSTSSALNQAALSGDSMMINWTAIITTSANPFEKIRKFFEAKELKRNMEQVIAHFKTYAEKSENLYGIKITQTTVTDTILMVLRKLQKNKPTESEIYSQINSIKKYVASAGATETNHPMLNTRFLHDQKSFELMVAIPVNKHLKGNDAIIWKRMFPGNILTAEVKGGPATVQQAMKQMENYVFDHQKVSPALQYQLLVTDRMKEKDTAKWITKIYYPVL
jgi:effector-binding domain-containing protein